VGVAVCVVLVVNLTTPIPSVGLPGEERALLLLCDLSVMVR